MRRLLLLAAIFTLPVISSAQVIENVHTKDGSIYSGYISEQLPGTHMSVCTENAYIVFNKAEVVDARKDYYDYNLLSQASKELIRDICDTTSLYLTSFEYRGKHFENLYVKETTDSSLCAYSLTPRTYFFPWSEVVKTSKMPIEEDSYGMREVVTLKSGERLVGHILEQETAQGMTIEDVDGRRHVVKSNDVLSVLAEKISDKHTIWEQTPLLDRVITNDGTMIEGLITSRIIGQNVSMLMRYNTEPQQINVENIRKYQKTRNSAYRKYVVDTTKVVRINDIDATLITLTKDEESYVRTDVNVNTFTVGTELNLVVKNITCGKTVALYEFQAKKKGREQSFLIPADALPIYETTFHDNDDYQECNLIVRKPGKYYIAIDGFETGLNVVFENVKED